MNRGEQMAGMDFFIRPANAMTSADWIRIENADISVSIQRRITRTVTRGGKPMIWMTKVQNPLFTLSRD